MPTFIPLTLDQLEHNFNELALDVLAKHKAEGDFDNLIKKSPERAAQLEFIDMLISLLKTSKLDAEKKALALTGALLYVKEEISKTYRFQAGWSPNHSLVFSRISTVVGESAENVMDQAAKDAVKTAFLDVVKKREFSEVLIAKITNPMLVPVLRESVEENSQAKSQLVTKEHIAQQAEKLNAAAHAKVTTQQKMKTLLINANFHQHVNRVKEDSIGQAVKLKKFELPVLNQGDFCITDAKKGKKESVFRFFGEVPLEKTRSAGIAAEVRRFNSHRRK